MHYRLQLWAALAIVGIGITLAPAQAEFRPKISVQAGSVIVNGQIAMRFQASNGNLTPGERAQITGERLKQYVAMGLNPYSLSVAGNKLQAKVFASGNLLCVVTKLDARMSRTSAPGLAQVWASKIRSLLLMPAVSLSEKTLLVPFGENRRVFVSGAASGPIYAKSDTDAVATAVSGLDGRYVQISGNQIGQAFVDISVEGEHALLTVKVMKYAGWLPTEVTAEVTGNPCPSYLVNYAATQAVMRRAVLEPGATVSIDRVGNAKRGLTPGDTLDAKYNVRISRDGFMTYGTQATVRVTDSSMPRDEVSQLFYSNNPERLLKFQTLFAGRLEYARSTRVLYHHQNAMGKRTRFMVELINPSVTSATFRVFRAVSGPMVDTVVVGYNATLGFLKDQTSNASVIEQVPAQSRLVLVSDSLGNLETSSGILQITQASGQGAYVRVAAIPIGQDDAPVGTVTPAQNVMALELSGHIYPQPVKTLDTEYVVGQRWAFISIGKNAIGSHDSQKKLEGNYGVTYNINVKVDNPTDQTKKVSVVFDPTAGLASGVFIIDGQFVSMKYAKPPAEISLASYQMKPGESRTVRITTVPVAGSNYPATLVVRS